MILVTGSTGQLGKATIDFLLKKIPANSIAAMVRDENKAADLKAKGIDVRKGDYSDVSSMVKAFQGIDKLLLISSSDMTDRAGQHINAINAAKEAGVKHIVYTSVDLKDPVNSAISFVASSHMATVEHLAKSGMQYTLMNNSLYADVLPMFLGEKVLETGVFFPAGTGRVPFTSRLDMAEAAATILAGNGHEGKEYVIAADTTYSLGDVAHSLSELSGKMINYSSPTQEVYAETLTKAGVPDMYISFMGAFAKAIADNEFDTKKTDLEKLLGRKPTALKDYLKATYFSNQTA